MQVNLISLGFSKYISPSLTKISISVRWAKQVNNFLEDKWVKITTFVFLYYFCIFHARSLQSCQTLCEPMDCILPGTSVHEILQARILEWFAMPSSRGSSQLRDRTHTSYVSCIGRQVFFFYHVGCRVFVIVSCIKRKKKNRRWGTETWDTNIGIGIIELQTESK